MPSDSDMNDLKRSRRHRSIKKELPQRGVERDQEIDDEIYGLGDDDIYSANDEDQVHSTSKGPKGEQRARATASNVSKTARPTTNISAKNGIKKKSISERSKLPRTSGSGFVQSSGPSKLPTSNSDSVDPRSTSASRSGGQVAPESNLKKFIIGIDYGTTFTSVSYHTHASGTDKPHADPCDVKSIRNWPNDPTDDLSQQVPTESWYARKQQVRPPAGQQFDISDSEPEDDDLASASGDQEDEIGQASDPNRIDDEASSKYLWGFDIQYQRYNANTTRDESRLVRRAKLMLVNSAHTSEDRRALRPLLNDLIRRRIIRKFGSRVEPSVRDFQDVISDFLIQVLRHAKEELIRLERFTPNCPVSFVLTVPSIWSPESSRVLQTAMQMTIKASNFCTAENGGMEDLFIISEPEAAATYLLGNSDEMTAGDTFIILDCGGGTVDGSTYTVTDSYPMRLNEEVVKLDGDNCGANYLNANYERLLLEKLKHEDYLEDNGDTRESMVQEAMPTFEKYHKRNFDVINGRPAGRVKIRGLRGDEKQGLTGEHAKRFEDNFILLNYHDYSKIFLPLLERVGKVLNGQLESASSKGKEVKKVFLIGGFGASQSLQSYLVEFLAKYNGKMGSEVKLIISDKQTFLRALNKEGGPQRAADSSYGFLRGQPYEPDSIPGHKKVRPYTDKYNGELYVTAIDYFMLKGDIIPSVHVFEPLRCFHCFDEKEPVFLCEEVLYVSDTATSSDYGLTSAMNQDAQVVGKILVNMTFLRDQNLIKPVIPKGRKKGGEKYYLVEYDLVPIVEGRNLRYEARYLPGEKGKVQQAAQISIAAAFRPGTA